MSTADPTFEAANDADIAGASDAASRVRRRLISPVAVGALLGRLKGLPVMGAEIWALVRRVALAMLARLARLFGVKLEHSGLQDGGDQEPRAAFTSDDPDVQPQAAAEEATSQLAAWIADVLDTPAQMWVQTLQQQGDAAAAFLAVSLDRLAGAISKAHDSRERLQADLEEGVAAAAARLAVEPAAVRALLAQPEAADALLRADPQLADLLQAYQRLGDSSSQLVRLKMAYCDQCAAALSVDAEGLGAIAKRNADGLSDPSVWETVQLSLAALQAREPEYAESPLGAGENPVHSEESQQTLTKTSSTGKKPVSRAQRFAGGVDDVPSPHWEPEDLQADDQPRVRPRQT